MTSPELVGPAALLACMFFSAKTLAAWHATVSGMPLPVWTPEELTFGLAAGLAGVVGLVMGASTSYDLDQVVGLIFFGVFPALCAVAGFKTSRRSHSMVPGLYAALSTLLTGAAICILAKPAVVEASLQTSERLAGWQDTMSSVLFFSAVFGLVGAALGQITSEDAWSGGPSVTPSS